MDDGVLIFVGVWVCPDNGVWRFNVSNRKYAKCVDVCAADTFEDLTVKVSKAFGICFLETGAQLSYWCEGQDLVFTQAKMPPVAIDTDSGLAKFKQAKKVNTGLNMYLTLGKQSSNAGADVGGDVCGSPKNGIIDVDDSYGDIRLGGDEFPGKSTADTCSTELLLRAVSEAEAAYKDRACGQQNTSADLLGPHATNAGSCGNVLTFEDPEFLKAIDEMEDGCLDKTRNSVNNKSIGKRKMVDDILTTPIRCGRKYGDINGDSDVGSVSIDHEVDYDFDKMRELIDKDYPLDLDPYADIRGHNKCSGGSLDKDVSGPNVPRTPHLSPIGFSLQIDYESVEVEELMVEDSGDVRKEIITQRTRARNPHGHVLRMSSLEDVDLREVHDRPPPTILLGKENIDTNIVPVDCHVKTWSADKDRGQPSPIGVDMDRIDNVDLREAQDIPHSTSLLGCDTIDNNIGHVSYHGKTRSADIDHTLQTNIVADTLSIVGDTNNPPDDGHERLDGQTAIILSATDNIDTNVAPVNCSARTSSADNARGPINEALEQFTAVLRNMDPSGHNSQSLSTDDVYVPDSGITNFMSMERGQSSNADNTIQTRNPTHFTQNVVEPLSIDFVDIQRDLDQITAEDPVLFTDAAPFRDNAIRAPSDKANMNLRRSGDALFIGRVFKDKNEMHKALSVYSIKRLFNFRIKASDKTRVIAICDDPKCNWRVYAINHKNSKNVQIRTATLQHNCCVGTRSQYGKKATATILGDLLKAKYAHGKKGPRACELPEIVLAELNVTISYMKAWNAKELAMHRARGNAEEGYKFLLTYLHLLKSTNPGTLSSVHTTTTIEGATLFKYLFFALGASIARYRHLRKVICIDGTETKGKYQSCLVAASGQDGNYQIFPLAFGIVDSENTLSWTWFFRQLSQFVPGEEDLVFVSDRHAAIYAGLRSVYPLAKHGTCTVHLFRNVKHHFKCEGLAVMVSNAARAYTVGDLRYWWDEIVARNRKCAEYLLEIGIPHWTLAFFSGMRYNLMSSNISESLNAALQKAIDFPVVTMVEFIRTMLMRWFCQRRAEANKTQTRCTPEIEEMLIEHLKDATDCAVIASTDLIFQVNDGYGCVFTVDLGKKTCTCRVFDVLMVPCCHALACVGIHNVDIYSLVGEYCMVEEWRKLWGEMILPPAREKDVDLPVQLTEVSMNPPKTKRGSGRPRTVRIPSQGEQSGKGGKKSKPNKCTTCGKNGHNRATCKNPI